MCTAHTEAACVSSAAPCMYTGNYLQGRYILDNGRPKGLVYMWELKEEEEGRREGRVEGEDEWEVEEAKIGKEGGQVGRG